MSNTEPVLAGDADQIQSELMDIVLRGADPWQSAAEHAAEYLDGPPPEGSETDHLLWLYARIGRLYAFQRSRGL